MALSYLICATKGQHEEQRANRFGRFLEEKVIKVEDCHSIINKFNESELQYCKATLSYSELNSRGGLYKSVNFQLNKCLIKFGK